MTERSGIDTGGDGLASALRRFPTHAAEIRTLMERDENFRSICEDLACVEQALLSVDQLPKDIRDERRREFTDLVDSLAVEIERALKPPNVIPITRHRDPSR